MGTTVRDRRYRVARSGRMETTVRDRRYRDGTQRPQAAPCAPGRRASGGHGRLEDGRLPGWSHLGCDHAGRRLHGPWRAVQPRRYALA
jgi:hypothetical protein